MSAVKPPQRPASPLESRGKKPFAGPLDWRQLVEWLSEDGVISPQEAQRTIARCSQVQSAQARVKKQLNKNIAAFKGLVKFSPFVAGDTFTQADCAAFASLPVIGMATKAIYGEDLLLSAGIDYKPYVKMIGERPAAQKVMADRKAAQGKAA